MDNIEWPLDGGAAVVIAPPHASNSLITATIVLENTELGATAMYGQSDRKSVPADCDAFAALMKMLDPDDLRLQVVITAAPQPAAPYDITLRFIFDKDDYSVEKTVTVNNIVVTTAYSCTLV